MTVARIFLALALALGLSACSTKFRTYNGPEVTQIQVHKAERKMYLLHNDKVLKVYDVALGSSPVGPKEVEGDGKTPEGAYFITHKNPRSEFYLSLGISYPSVKDVEHAKELGSPAGGDIYIHGGPTWKITRADWTAGCIAVTDREMEVIYSMVKPGTVIFILP